MPGDTLHQPNDKLLKATFSIPENARAFFKHHLPPDVSTAIVWDTLTLEPASFVDPQFAASESDLLFQAKFQQTDTFLYLLFEHQSTEDPRMALRLLSYVVRIWERFASGNPHPAKLPPIFPLVLAQAKRPWKTSTKFQDLIDLASPSAEGLHPWQPSFVYQLMELVSTPYEAIGGTPEGILTLRALKAEPVQELLSDQVFDEALFPSISKDALERLLRYIFNGELNKTLFMERISQIKTPKIRRSTMTLADQFREEGKMEGISIGLEKGISEGISQGISLGLEKGLLSGLIAVRNSVLRVLELKHSCVPEGLAEAIHSISDLPKLEQLLVRALESGSLEEFAQYL